MTCEPPIAEIFLSYTTKSVPLPKANVENVINFDLVAYLIAVSFYD